VDAHAGEVWRRAVAAYATLCPPDLSGRVAPGIPELLDRLAARPDAFRLSLVTGNLEPVARLKLDRAGLGRHFPPGQGGFGSDHESRAELPPIARARASDPPWPRERTVVIGDTPRDIACARADRVRVAAVGTGPFGVEDLAEADAVVDDARALLPVLEDWL
jgi:phosphoglycolate phosphatase-like HAD superfamily hydrolase